MSTEAPVVLAKPVWIKVKDIEKGTSGFNVKVKVVKAEKELNVISLQNGKKLTLVKATVGDETGVADALFKLENHEIIAEGKVIAIRNGRRQIVKGHICLEIDIFGRITEEKDDVKATGELNISAQEIKRREGGSRERRKPRRREDDDYRRDREPREDRREREDRGAEYRRDREDRRDRGGDRYDREDRRPREDRGGERRERREGGDRREGGERREGGDRREGGRRDDRPREDRGGERRERREGGDRREGGEKRDGGRREREQHEEKKNVTYIKVEEIGPGDEEIYFIAKVTAINERKETRNDQEKTYLDCVLGDGTAIVDGSFFANVPIKKGQVYAFKNMTAKVVREHIQIQKGRFGRVEEVDTEVRDVNTKVNISAKSYVLDE